ncbi:NAD-dependent epimerase/dehydratase family protein [Actinopolymorpha pittospori]|nr:NAD-dependent epimerase/dehydratase family protein [Actinopolymorpha pittospori]
MRLLILGGTSFVGRAIVADALQSGAEVTLFGRGKTGADLFPDVPRRIGDRDSGDYAALQDGSWDAVVDVSGYVPRHVRQAMETLDDRVDRYLFISSHAVYVDEAGPGNDESTPRRPPERDTEKLDQDTYGRCKVACEDDVVGRYGSRATIVRSGKVAGPHDTQDTFTYWVRRAACGGRVALPGEPEQPVQVIDVRDLARLVVQLLFDERGGAFNAVGPAQPSTLAELIHTCAAAAGTQVELVPIPADTVPRLFPLVRPAWSTQQRSADKARGAGLPATPLHTTAADVLAWDRLRGQPPLRCGLSPADEEKLLREHSGSR